MLSTFNSAGFTGKQRVDLEQQGVCLLAAINPARQHLASYSMPTSQARFHLVKASKSWRTHTQTHTSVNPTCKPITQTIQLFMSVGLFCASPRIIQAFVLPQEAAGRRYAPMSIEKIGASEEGRAVVYLLLKENVNSMDIPYFLFFLLLFKSLSSLLLPVFALFSVLTCSNSSPALYLSLPFSLCGGSQSGSSKRQTLLTMNGGRNSTPPPPTLLVLLKPTGCVCSTHTHTHQCVVLCFLHRDELIMNTSEALNDCIYQNINEHSQASAYLTFSFLFL